jgi:hypothetical protein
MFRDYEPPDERSQTPENWGRTPEETDWLLHSELPEYEPPDECGIPERDMFDYPPDEYDAWLDGLHDARDVEPIAEPPDDLYDPQRERAEDRQDAIAALDDAQVTADPFDALLAEAYAVRLHSHDCSGCGRKQFPCASVPCEFRPFDRAGDGRRWRCHDCEEK